MDVITPVISGLSVISREAVTVPIPGRMAVLFSLLTTWIVTSRAWRSGFRRSAWGRAVQLYSRKPTPAATISSGNRLVAICMSTLVTGSTFPICPGRIRFETSVIHTILVTGSFICSLRPRRSFH